MTITHEERELIDALDQIPMTPAHRAPADADLDEVLDFFKREREVDLFAQLGDCPSDRPAQRYVALNLDGEYIRTLDHVYGPGHALEHLADHFQLDPIAHIEATRCAGNVVLFLAEADAKRLGGSTFVAKAERVLKEAVRAIPAVRAEQALAGMNDSIRLTLIRAGALARREAQGLSGARRDALMATDLGL
jgi:hypothetical protein